MTFTPDRSDAVRSALIEAAVPRRTPPRRAVLLGLCLVVAGALAGGSATALATGGGWLARPASPPGATAPADPIEAPPGEIPGVPIVSVIGEPVSQTVTTARTISLADRPAAATHARVSVACLSAGTIAWGTDPGGNNPSLTCGSPRDGSAWYDFPLDATVTTLDVTPSGSAEASVTIQYLSAIPTRLGINARGETYGIDGTAQGTPDLIAAVGSAPDGGDIQGYVRAADLSALSPDHPGQPADPSQALRRQQERTDRYPSGWDIPLVESDGLTQIGTFHVG